MSDDFNGIVFFFFLLQSIPHTRKRVPSRVKGLSTLVVRYAIKMIPYILKVARVQSNVKMCVGVGI